MTTDLASMTSDQVAHLPPETLTPILRDAYRASHGREIDDTDLKAALDMVKQEHWVSGLPARHPHPDGPEAGLAELFGEPQEILCHHNISPAECADCPRELRLLRERGQ